MKIRYVFAAYTLVMGVLLFFIMASFQRDTPRGRDMVYYNEQFLLAEKAIEAGREKEEVEAEFGCEILFTKDRDYQMKLQDALQREALILDYFRGEELAGKIVWRAITTKWRRKGKGRCLFFSLCSF